MVIAAKLGLAFSLRPASWPASRGRSKNAGQKPGGSLKRLTPPGNAYALRSYPQTQLL
jgi:hypothetical protein